MIGIAFSTFNNTNNNFPSSAGLASGWNPGSDFKKRTTHIDLATTGANFVVDIANQGIIVECSLGLRFKRGFAE
jgi:hypothetical protein